MNINHEHGIQDLLDIAKSSDMSARMRRRVLGAVDKLLKGQIEYEDRLQDLQAHLLRNPAFPDDWVGWLDDDFHFPDEDEDDSEA